MLGRLRVLAGFGSWSASRSGLPLPFGSASCSVLAACGWPVSLPDFPTGGASAAEATASSDPPSIWARRTSTAATPAAVAMASTMMPSSAPWRRSPAISRVRKDRSAVARACEQRSKQSAPLRLRPRAGGRADLCEDHVDGGQRQARGSRDRAVPGGGVFGSALRGGSSSPVSCQRRGIRCMLACTFAGTLAGARRPGAAGDIPQCRIADADLALAQFAGQERDRDRNLRRLRATQQVRDRVDLGAARRGRRYRGGGPHQFIEQHTRIVPDGTDTSFGPAVGSRLGPGVEPVPFGMRPR